MIELILKNILNVVLFISISMFVGFGVLRLLHFKITQSYSGAFKIFLIGFFLIVMLFAVVVSKGNTVLLGFILIGVFLWWDNRHSRQEVPEDGIQASITIPFLLKRVLELSIVSLVIIIYRTAFMDDGGYFIESVYNDYVFYAKLSKYLLETGIENAEFDYIFLEHKVVPYHYVDIWINSLLIYLTHQNVVELMILSSYTIGIAGIWLGLVALLEAWLGATSYNKVIALFLVFTTGIFWGAFINVPFLQSADVFARHSLNYSKLFPIYWMLILVILLYKDGNTFRGKFIITVLLALPIINISSAPGVFLVIFLLFLNELFRGGSFKWEIALKATLIVLLIAIFYKTGQSDSGGDWSFDYKEYTSITYIKTFINVMGGTFIQVILLYLPIFLVMLFTARQYGFKSVRDVLLVIGVTFFAFVIPWALFHRNANSVQLFSNTFIPFIACFLIAVGCDIIKIVKNKVYRSSIIGVMLLLPAIGLLKDIKERKSLADSTSATQKSVQDCIEFFSVKVKNPVGVFFSSDTNWATKALPFGALDMKLQQFVNKNGFHTISLSILDTPLDSGSIHFANEREQIKNALFYRYLQKQSKYSLDNLAFLQRKFIKDFNIEYVLTNYNYSLSDDKIYYLQPVYDVPAINLKVYSVIRARL